ncbi:hypothetical protein ARMGADRAFT_1022854 [Armillaria gallica]|uniref:Uncharacterized protein n=1 Tax=Armillaria gallica TaxID=47427 RepID=A0A2H3EPN2_ARMGA|nr:hypothetical protein ARMGADRAFT_1022854 [Armillaria gallica]
MPSIVRQSFMATFPGINRTWKAVYAPIASQDIYIPSLAYIYYLCDIAGRQKSVIYHDLIPRLTRTITCFVDLRENVEESAAKEVYDLLMRLPNDIGLKALFPQVPSISFGLSWIGNTGIYDWTYMCPLQTWILSQDCVVALGPPSSLKCTILECALRGSLGAIIRIIRGCLMVFYILTKPCLQSSTENTAVQHFEAVDPLLIFNLEVNETMRVAEPFDGECSAQYPSVMLGNRLSKKRDELSVTSSGQPLLYGNTLKLLFERVRANVDIRRLLDDAPPTRYRKSGTISVTGAQRSFFVPSIVVAFSSPPSSVFLGPCFLTPPPSNGLWEYLAKLQIAQGYLPLMDWAMATCTCNQLRCPTTYLLNDRSTVLRRIMVSKGDSEIGVAMVLTRTPAVSWPPFLE